MPFLPDIGLGELLIIGLIALFVVGPERLPVVMEKLGILFANARHFVQGMSAGWGLSDAPDAPQMTAKKPRKSAAKAPKK